MGVSDLPFRCTQIVPATKTRDRKPMTGTAMPIINGMLVPEGVRDAEGVGDGVLVGPKGGVARGLGASVAMGGGSGVGGGVGCGVGGSVGSG